MAKKISEKDPTCAKPDDMIIDEAEQIRQSHDARQQIFSDINTLFDNSHDIPFPASIPVNNRSSMTVKSGLAAEIWDRVDGLFVGTRRIKIFPDSISKKAAGTAEQIEDFSNAYFIRSEEEADDPVYDLRRRDCIGYGIGGGWQFMIPDAWKDLPRPYIADPKDSYSEQAEKTAKSYQEIMEAKQGCHLPIAYRASAGPSLFPVYDDWGLSAVYEIFWDSALNIAKRYPDSEFATEFYKSHKDNAARVKAQVPLLRYANRKWCAMATINGASLSGLGSEIKPDNASFWSNQKQLLKVWEHNLPYNVPYTVMKGYTTTRKSPDKSSFGVLYHLRELIPYFDTLLSQRAAYIRMFAWPTPILKKMNVSLAQAVAEAQGGKREDFVWNEGELIQLHPGEDMTFLVLQGGGQEIEAQLATVLRLIDRAGLSAVTAGMSSADATSGYALSTLIQASQTKLAIYEKHLQQGHVRDVQMLLQYIMANNLTMYVFDKSKEDGKWLSLSADDIGGHIPQMESKVKADVKQDMGMLLQTAQVAKQEGFWSLTTGQEYIGVEDPVKEQRRTIIDQTMTSQEIRSLIANKIIERTTEALEQEADRAPTPEMAAQFTPAQQAALLNLQGQGAGLPPEVVANLPGGAINPTNPQQLLDQAGLPPAPGAPNTNVPVPAANRAPNPPPPNAGGATGIPGPERTGGNRSRRRGGRRAGSNRQAGGPRYG